MTLLLSRPGHRPGLRRAVASAAVLAMTVTGIVAAAPAAAAAPSAEQATVDPAPADHPAVTAQIRNASGLTVTVGTDFPQIVSYDLNGKTINGQAEQLSTFTINGTDHTATTTSRISRGTATYKSTFADFPGVTITSTITAGAENTVKFAMTKIAGRHSGDIDEISIPDQSLISVDSSDAESALARTKISTDSTTTADRFIPIDGSAKVDAKPVGSPYGFVNNSQLAAGIMTNATDDSKQDNNDNWNTRLDTQIVDAGHGARRAELSVGNWTWAPAGVTDNKLKTYELPTATIVLAGDLNDNGHVTWQDAAIAYRNHMTKPLGSDRVPDRVVAHIPFNFASQATNPFLKSLDNVKRISMSTDNLGQWVLEKGYANEGHDSGHPDYGNDFNTRAGGLKDLNMLTKRGAQYNADIAVHVNATEAYPGAKDFTDRMVKGQPLGWDWLNQAYHIDQRYDLGSGNIIDRFKQLKKQAPGISTVYIDAYYSSGWLADELASQLHDMGFEVSTEWAYKFEGNSIWSHWANDKNYGGATNKGINSNISRFIENSDADIWNTDKLLGGSDIKEFEGWTGQNSWNAFYKNIWTTNLPTKFLQHYQLMNWKPDESAQLTGGVSVRMKGDVREISMGDAVVLKGGTYLLPWGDSAKPAGTTSPSRADKMYYYNPDGGPATFDLTRQFAGHGTFTLYKLTDQGRVKVGMVHAKNGAVTLDGDKGQPYVLAPAHDKAPHAGADYGDGTRVADPGFNAGNLKDWDGTGGAKIVTTDNGDNVARLGTATSGIHQKVKGLTPGTKYSVSANIEIGTQQGRETTLEVGSGNNGHGSAGAAASNTFDLTPAKNYMASDAKKGTYSQRASVTFTAPNNGHVEIGISAAAGKSPVTIDDVRIMQDTSAPKQKRRVADENFEGNQPGWGPFVKGDAGGATDPRTSYSERHAPYTQKKWKNAHAPYNAGSLDGKAVDDVLNGNHSLKSHEENKGLVYRTTPATVPLTSGHSYKVSFNYQTNVAGQWRWVTGSDSVAGGELTTTERKNAALPVALGTKGFSQTITAGCGDDTWMGLKKVGGAAGADFIIDDFTVTDLGKTKDGVACATLDAPSSTKLNPGTPMGYTTKFTNNESTEATNVAMTLGTLPDGWKAEVTEKDGNLFKAVKPGETVSTKWLVTPPKSAAGASATLTPDATYLNNCATKTVSAQSHVDVTTRPVVPPASMTASADSENTSPRRPAGNVLDGDPSTLWHTNYTGSIAPYPHWLTLKLDGESTLDGFGYQGRASGGDNGKVKDYTVSVSKDGKTWTDVASGTLADSTDMQVIDFDPVTAKYVKFTATSALNGLQFAAAAEMRAYGTTSTVPTGYTPGVRVPDDPCTR